VPILLHSKKWGTVTGLQLENWGESITPQSTTSGETTATDKISSNLSIALAAPRSSLLVTDIGLIFCMLKDCLGLLQTYSSATSPMLVLIQSTVACGTTGFESLSVAVIHTFLPRHRECIYAGHKSFSLGTVWTGYLLFFSDESKFLVFDAFGPNPHWKKKGAPPKPSDVLQVVKHGGGSVLVWGCITRLGVGHLHHITGRMTAAKYTETLSDAYLLSLRMFGLRPQDVIFQHDNDPKHTSRHARKWLLKHRVRVLPWPSSSPDMNPIEHVWAQLDRAVRARPILPRNRDELWEALEEEWYKLPSDFIANLYNSMAHRVGALMEAKGGHTQY
jgi:transposase